MSPLILYNTLSRKKEVFKPINDDLVRLYCCGPTVYNYAHIGNLRTYIFEDLLRRILEFNDYKVKHVMNITDVGHLTSDADEGEDKMEKGRRNMLYIKCKKCEHDIPIFISVDRGSVFQSSDIRVSIKCRRCGVENEARKEKNSVIKSNVFYKNSKKLTVWEIADNYTQAFLSDMKALNLKDPEVKCKATDHIQEMIDQVKQLEENGLTYTANGNVYFDTAKLEDYGKLALLDRQELKAGARIEVDENKKNPHDFVLWFTKSKFDDQEMKWDSPWGRGYPGWHIECSAMCMKHLGDHADIHCGGIDHIPVHHTNEIAQAEGATGKKPWVNFWMHGNFLVLGESEKMAKSAGNFLRMQTLIDKGFDPLDYRYFCLQAHYRKELTFSWESLEAAKTARRRLKNKVKAFRSHRVLEGAVVDSHHFDSFVKAVNDDLNLPEALAATWAVIDEKDLSDADKWATILEFDKILGLKLNEEEKVELSSEIQQLIEARNEARANKDWQKSDQLRDEIQAAGYIVKDGPNGTEVESK